MRPILLLLLCAAPLRAADGAAELFRLRFELADRITAGVLDPIFGEGGAFAFTDFSVELARKETGNEKLGRGSSDRQRRKSDGAASGGAAKAGSADDPEDAFASQDPDAEEFAAAAKQDRAGASPGAAISSESRQGQYSRQSKLERENRDSLSVELRGLRVVVVHRSPADAKRLAAAREALLAVFPGELDAGRIVFKAVPGTEP